MSRLLVHVEGQTEEGFVNDVLSNAVLAMGYYSVSARIVGNARLRQRRGGIRPWLAVKSDIVNHLNQDRGCLATTMVDYYALPDSWPGRTAARNERMSGQASFVEAALVADIAPQIDVRRFVPFVVMHEFEALLFSDCAAFCKAMGRPNLESKVRAIRDEFDNPEEINDSPMTAPSKRIASLFPEYQKPLYGVLAAREIGLDRMAAECPHFAAWLSRLRSALFQLKRSPYRGAIGQSTGKE
jgi:hypothetical protein